MTEMESVYCAVRIGCLTLSQTLRSPHTVYLCVLCGSETNSDYWILGASAILRKATISFMSVRPSAWNNSAPTGRISMKSGISVYAYFENLSRKFKFLENLPRIPDTLPEDQCTYLSHLDQLFL